MLSPKFTGRRLRILDYDIENRPLSYWYQGETTPEVTAIAAKFIGEPETYCWLLGRDDPEDMLEGFRDLYEQADIVTGHYIRNHDLPIVNGALIEFGKPTLSQKMTSDTKNDLIGFKGLSKSQENLAAMLGVPAPKVQMNQTSWREANRLTPEGLMFAEQRVVGDISQHIQLRRKLIELRMLKPPRLWKAN